MRHNWLRVITGTVPGNVAAWWHCDWCMETAMTREEKARLNGLGCVIGPDDEEEP